MNLAMTSPAFSATCESEVESLLAGQLAAADRALAGAYPILRHRLGSDGDALLSDRIVAQVRAQIEDLAGQLTTDGGCHEALADKLTDDAALVRHLHALALEAELAERLSKRLALDPVLSPLLQALLPDHASAKDLIAAQARFVQAQRRCEQVFAELPGELRLALVATQGTTANRLGLLDQMVSSLDDPTAGLDVAHAGVALFASALAGATGMTRETALVAMSQAQAPRLALALRAAGLAPSAIEPQLFAFDPDARSPGGLDALSPQRAAALLAGAR